MKVRVVVLAVAAAVAVLGSQMISTAGFAGDAPFKARKFASVPSPDMPWGVVVDHGFVRVSTGSAGVNYPQSFEDWRVFAFHEATGKLSLPQTVVIPRLRSVSTMGLANMAFDAQRRLYIADMNGRVLRVNLRTKKTEVYARIPVWSTTDALLDMPFDVAFDRAGNLYVADGGPPIIWRVPPGPAGRDAEPWFQDVRISGNPAWGGPRSIALAPNGKELYFGLCNPKNHTYMAQSVILRLPINNPSSDNLREFHKYPGPFGQACPTSLVFGSTGKLYVALSSADAIQVLRPNGKEERRFAADSPAQIAFDGKGSVYVASMDTDTVLKALVNDRGYRIVRPRVP